MDIWYNFISTAGQEMQYNLLLLGEFRLLIIVWLFLMMVDDLKIVLGLVVEVGYHIHHFNVFLFSFWELRFKILHLLLTSQIFKCNINSIDSISFSFISSLELISAGSKFNGLLKQLIVYHCTVICLKSKYFMFCIFSRKRFF